jgi:ketosteroid isomerase-like protein
MAPDDSLEESLDDASGAELVRELGRRFRAGDTAGAMAIYDPDVRVEQPASLPHGGVHRGADGLAAMGAEFGRHWDRTIGEAELLEAGDRVVQLTTQTWTARATGRSATVDVVELLTIVDGHITEIRVFQQDTALLLSTLDPS